ncbi:hypothetical protein SFMTTN_2033 [Sulfuriferula multivorans]|uniref:Uncharacterized protein n=1 Tax=Sulfuriferula multivorans TaxID=1559896 RepID=A0A401JF23_9PROT|nr:hypothetical protein SFMTTN_2033 [Sulfuriferula multivorans]
MNNVAFSIVNSWPGFDIEYRSRVISNSESSLIRCCTNTKT